MEISVIVTNYNYGRYLGRCLRSLTSQDFPNNKFEIVLVDDASSDDSIEVANAFLDQVRLIQLDSNQGLSIASNTGIRHAKGRYVVRVDSDDYVHQDFLRTLITGFEFYGQDFEAVSCDYLRVTPNGEILSIGDAASEPIACAIAFKMDAIEAVGYYDGDLRINEEVDLRSRFADQGFSVKNINLPLYRYVQHGSSLSRKTLI